MSYPLANPPTPARALPKRRPRMAIVSTYDELCGIAGYTRALVRYLAADFDIEVFDLDQYLLRHTNPRVVRLGDQHIKEIAARLSTSDCVNIQLEHGTLGRTVRQIVRRYRWLLNAAPAVSVTMHTMLDSQATDWEAVWGAVSTGRISRGFDLAFGGKRDNLLAWRCYTALRQLQRRKPVHVIVHTRRDMRHIRDVERIPNVHHHPLSYVSRTEAAEIRGRATRDSFPLLRHLPADAKLIGTFGFLNEYKGFETVILALRKLPPNYHLLVFGGIHPQGIRKHQKLDPYIARMLDVGRIDKGIIDQIGEAKSQVSMNLDSHLLREVLTENPLDLSQRLHFMGAQSDEEFLRAMAICDAVVLPYLEVGQSSSGPISMAVDMGCRVLASRTLAFLQFGRYFPGRLEMFDIGNFLELADRLRSDPLPGSMDYVPDYDITTNRAVYVAANPGKRTAKVPFGADSAGVS